MIGNRNLFFSLDDSIKTEVKIGIYIVVHVMGKGMVNIITKQGKQKSLEDVLRTRQKQLFLKAYSFH